MGHVLADPEHPSWPQLKKMVEEGIKSKSKVVKPFKVQVFREDCLQDAFRTAGEVHDTKILVKVCTQTKCLRCVHL